MISESKYLNIKSRYGKFASWAIWDLENEANTEIIEQNLDKLHCNWIVIGLNISKPVGIWENFHGGRHDRKIKKALRNTEISGAYMTDLIKKSEKSSIEIKKAVRQKSLDIHNHVNYFVEELTFVGVNDKTQFIIFGNAARDLYHDFYENHFPENKVYYLKHYSSRGTDKDWVEHAWKSLNINFLKYEDV